MLLKSPDRLLEIVNLHNTDYVFIREMVCMSYTII